jgi:outer membrane protein
MRKILIAILFCFSAASYGQDSASVTKLNYTEAIKIGLEKNVVLNQQKNNLFSRQVQRNQSISNFLPNLYIQGGANRNIGQQANPENGNFENLTVDNVFASINAELTIFNGFTRINALNQNSNYFRSQLSYVERSKQDVIANVTSQYLQVLLDQELLKIAEENYKTQQIVLDQLAEQVALGSRAESEKYTQEAQVRNMELIALRSKVTLQNDKALLSQTLQLDPELPFEVTFPEQDQNIMELSDLSLDSLNEIALQSRQDLKQQQFQVKGNKYAYKSSVSGYYPRLTIFANYGSVYYSPIPFNFHDQFYKNNKNYTYGVSLYVPIFDRMVTRSTRVANKVLYDNSVLQEENLEKTIKIDVQRALNNYKAAIQAYRSSQTQFQAGELALKTQQESFVLGATDQVALALANQTYVQAAASRAQAEVTLAFQKVLFEYALGTLNIGNLN